jgi:hypothetical protein
MPSLSGFWASRKAKKEAQRTNVVRKKTFAEMEADSIKGMMPTWEAQKVRGELKPADLLDLEGIKKRLALQDAERARLEKNAAGKMTFAEMERNMFKMQVPYWKEQRRMGKMSQYDVSALNGFAKKGLISQEELKEILG